jgi:mono/diheme cytochrome c family protein
MYVVDMHRGIIQHKAYISQYLTEQLAGKKLDTLQNAGRILKVTHKTIKPNPITDLSKATSKELVGFLSHPNGWLRDRAQQLLIQKKDKKIVKDLIGLTKTENEFSTSIHALYVLDGLNALSFDILTDIVSQSKQPETIAHAVGLLERFASMPNVAKMKTLCTQLLAQNKETIDLYLPMSLNAWLKTSETSFLPILSEIDKKYDNQRIFQEAITSSLEGKEELYLTTMKPSDALKNNLTSTLNNHQKNELNSIFVREKNTVDDRTRGLKLFRTICAACHGADGKGIQDLAPPLKGSEYIDGSMHRLASIILHGMSGPVHVNGKLYQLNNDMPGLISNTSISDQDIADIIKFTQNAFAKEGKGIRADEVKKLRDKKPSSGGLFNEKELLEGVFER